MEDSKEKEPKRAGIAVLVGRSNVGKSTLLNTIMGTKVAITTSKAQTTRHTIQGAVNDPRGQVVFVDTPGIFSRVPDMLTGKLNERAKESLNGVDVVVYVVDPTRHTGDEEERVHQMATSTSTPKILVLNKSDMKRDYIDEYLAWRDEFDAVIEVSALQEKNIAELISTIFDYLPEGEPLYPSDQLTDRDSQFRLGELIREKVFIHLSQELPYTTTVVVNDSVMRDNGTLYIDADVITTSPRYRKMIIGAGAKKIKGIGSAVRKELEIVTGHKIYLDLNVTVDEKWQERFD